MKRCYLLVQLFFLCGYLYTNTVSAQLTATITGYESRCAATGAIKIVASGGSGAYQYKVTGPVTTNFTGQDSITGLSSGLYTVIVNDINTNATFTQTGFPVFGSYADPGFGLVKTDVTCDNGFNGSISVNGFVLNGRSPFVFTIVAPSPMGVGTSNSTGNFDGLKAGDYSIQLNDSCGGIQTRTITINNYTWSLDSYSFTKTSCDLASGNIFVKDSKGNNSKFTTLPGFSYGVVRSPGDTIWTSDGIFNNITVTGLHSIDVLAKDGCGNIKKVTMSLFLAPSLDASVKITNKGCTTFTAAVTGATNFFPATYTLYNSSGVQIDNNTSGRFDNLPYGSYCIEAHDGCTDSTIERCFTQAAPIASVAANVTVFNKTCTDFSAKITGQQNLSSPDYCVLNSLGDTLSCNSTGVFDNLAYGDYCIVIRDNCMDTTITRCFSASRPVPHIPDVILPSYVTCTVFGLHVTGDSLTNPVFCLYDTTNNQIGLCNTTGIFDSIPLGSYYVTVHDGCIDTTIRRDFSVGMPVVTNDVNVSLSDKTCTTFTATATSSNLSNAEFCLYNASDSSLVTCDSSGQFTSLPYGSYYIVSRNGCPDTTVLTSFTGARDLPSVNPNVQVSNRACASFSAKIIDWQNLVSPEFCLIDTVAKDTLDCNTTGIFDNVPFGAYLIQIVSGCNDTLRVPFAQQPDSLILQVSASKTCNYGFSKFTIIATGILPVNIQIYTPAEELLIDTSFNSATFSIDNIPALDSTDAYMIVGTDACGNKDTVYQAPVVGYLTHVSIVKSQCPGSVWPNGSGNITSTVTTNLASLNVKIVAKNGTGVSINPDFVSLPVYTFNDLGPGVYVIRYQTIDVCTLNTFDTVTITNYQYPSLAKSSAYQCDVNGFSIGAVASNGVGPFTYEIIGSTPSIPSLIAPPQSDPVFTVNNGTTYSLIRLRALDACGNATLGDASILPLADNGIRSTLNCMQSPTTLSVDTIYNSSYSWFKKTSVDGTDSVAVTDGFNYYIPEVLPTDTGIYVCHIRVNNGCINRTYYFHLDGSCFAALPLDLEDFSGALTVTGAELKWKINHAANLRQIIVERRTGNYFEEIGTADPSRAPGESVYRFVDKTPSDRNFYRIKLVKYDNSFTYSNIILLQKEVDPNVIIYPNPATAYFNIQFNQAKRHTYRISLVNMLNQNIKEIVFSARQGNTLQVKRTADMPAGLYILRFLDTDTNTEFSQKLVLKTK